MKRSENHSAPTPEAVAAAGSPKAKARLINRGLDLGRGLKRADDVSRREVPAEFQIAEQLAGEVDASETIQGLSALAVADHIEETWAAEEAVVIPDWQSARTEDIVTDQEMADAWEIPVDVIRGVNQEHDVYQAAIGKKKAKVMPRAEEKLKPKRGEVVPLISGKGVKDSVRTIGHAASSVRNAVRPSAALEREAIRRAAEDTAIEQLNKAFGAGYATREIEPEDPICPYTQCAKGSVSTVGSRAMLSEISGVGGFHIVGEEDLKDEMRVRRGAGGKKVDGILVDLEEEFSEEDVNGNDLSLEGIVPQTVIEEEESLQAAMDYVLTSADQA